MNLFKKSGWIVCALAYLTFAAGLMSCSNDSDPLSPARTSEQVIARFKSYLYLVDGQVNAQQLPAFESTEWAVATDSPQRPLEVFSDITGLPTPLKDPYEYSYVSSDKKCSIQIIGMSTPNAEGIYATMYIQIEECEEITQLHICTPQYFNTFEGDGMQNPENPGIPVKW